MNAVRIRPRIRFQAVSLSEHQSWHGDPDRISGKIDLKDSPFSGWLQARLTSTSLDHLCVPDASSLEGHGARVTLTCQTRDGDKGAHGESGATSIIGFTNERRLAEIELSLGELLPQISRLLEEKSGVRVRQNLLQIQKESHRYVLDTAWEAIDYQGVESQIAELKKEIATLRANSSVLDALQAEEERLVPLLAETTKVRVRSEDRCKALEE